MSDLLVTVGRLLRLAVLCISGIVCVIFSFTALSAPAIMMLARRDGEEYDRNACEFSVILSVSVSVISFLIWKALYYRTWQPAIWMLKGVIPFVIIFNIIISAYEKKLK